MINPHSHAYWAAWGAACGGAITYTLALGFQFGLGRLGIAVGVVVGALFGAALRG